VSRASCRAAKWTSRRSSPIGGIYPRTGPPVRSTSLRSVQSTS
jgi:hypothetical protein